MTKIHLQELRPPRVPISAMPRARRPGSGKGQQWRRWNAPSTPTYHQMRQRGRPPCRTGQSGGRVLLSGRCQIDRGSGPVSPKLHSGWSLGASRLKTAYSPDGTYHAGKETALGETQNGAHGDEPGKVLHEAQAHGHNPPPADGCGKLENGKADRARAERPWGTRGGTYAKVRMGSHLCGLTRFMMRLLGISLYFGFCSSVPSGGNISRLAALARPGWHGQRTSRCKLHRTRPVPGRIACPSCRYPFRGRT